jgi:hypothetical protein
MPDQWASTSDHAPSTEGWATTADHSPEFHAQQKEEKPGFGSRLYSSTIGPAVDLVQNFPETMKEYGKMFGGSPQLQHIKEHIDKGNYAQAALAMGKHLALGPIGEFAESQAKPIVQDLSEGNYAGAAGGIVGNAAMLAAPKVAGLAGEALRPVGTFAKGAVRAAADAAPAAIKQGAIGGVAARAVGLPGSLGATVAAAPDLLKAAVKGGREALQDTGAYLRPEDAQFPIRGIPMREPVTEQPPVVEPAPERFRAGDEIGDRVTPGLAPGETAEDYFNRVIKPQTGETAGVLPGEDAELLNGLAQHYENTDFAKLDAATQAKIRALASPKTFDASPPPRPITPEEILPPQQVAPSKTIQELLQEEMAAKRSPVASAPVASADIPVSKAQVPPRTGVNVPLRPPLATSQPTAAPVAAESPAIASNPKAMAIAEQLKAEMGDSPKPKASTTDYAGAQRPFKAMALAQPLYELGIKADALERLGGVPSPQLKAAVKALGINETGEISPETLRMTIDEIRKLESAAKKTRPKKSLGDMMK